MNSTKVIACLVFFFSFLLLISPVAAISLTTPSIVTPGEPAESGISLISDPEDLINITYNVSVNSATNWDTLDHGQLDSVSDINHNWLSAIQGGSSGEYYHLNSSIYTYLG